MEFDTAHENFVAAARLGLRAQFEWPGHHHIPADELILSELLPIAREGLLLRDIDAADADRYLDVLEERVRSKRTGAQWQLESYSFLRERGNRAERLAAITAAAVENQQSGRPVSTWPVATLEHAGGSVRHLDKVEQFMTTDLFTVGPDEAIELVANLMTWKKIRHVPVEDSDHRLVGIVSQRTLARLIAERVDELGKGTISVRDVMAAQLITVAPETATLEAIALMKKNKVGSLPVVKDGRLVGIVTESDFLTVSAELLEEQLRRDDGD
jgi:CBS domain-containing protein